MSAPQVAVFPFSQSYLLSEEERYALVDMVRYGSLTAVSPEFREQLLMNLAHAAVTSMYGSDALPVPFEQGKDEEPEEMIEFEPCDMPLAITFTPLNTLTNTQG